MIRPLGIALVLLLGCSGDDETCLTVDSSCQPLYEPTFDEVFSRTLAVKCGVPGGACHAAEGARGGLVLDDPEQAHSMLLDGRVVPGDPGCSPLVQRLESRQAGFGMPPGNPLTEAERCALIRWIADGAER